MKINLFLRLLPVLFMTSGCAATTYGTKDIDRKLASLEKEVTTKSDILKVYGPPKEVIPLEIGNEMMIYESFTEKPNRRWFPSTVHRYTKRLTLVMGPDQKLKEFRVDDLFDEIPYDARYPYVGSDYYSSYPRHRYGGAVSVGADF